MPMLSFAFIAFMATVVLFPPGQIIGADSGAEDFVQREDGIDQLFLLFL